MKPGIYAFNENRDHLLWIDSTGLVINGLWRVQRYKKCVRKDIRGGDIDMYIVKNPPHKDFVNTPFALEFLMENPAPQCGETKYNTVLHRAEQILNGKANKLRKSDLIDRLNEIEGDPIVMVAQDAEGNGFNKAFDVELSPVNEDGEPCHADDAEGDKQKVIVIWP